MGVGGCGWGASESGPGGGVCALPATAAGLLPVGPAAFLARRPPPPSLPFSLCVIPQQRGVCMCCLFLGYGRLVCALFLVSRMMFV